MLASLSRTVILPVALGLLPAPGCGGGPPADEVRFEARVYGPGEAAGFLRVIPQGQPLESWSHRDVLVVSDAPLDLSIVAALISAGPLISTSARAVPTGRMDAGEPEPDARAPKPWPPQGEKYLTRIDRAAQFDALARDSEVLFFLRRGTNDRLYPYPWDQHECVFQNTKLYEHFPFLQAMDSDRAVVLYIGEARSEKGSLLAGRVRRVRSQSQTTLAALLENWAGFDLVGPSFPLAPATVQGIRERLIRCLPFGAGLPMKIEMFCGGSGNTCPAQ